MQKDALNNVHITDEQVLMILPAPFHLPSPTPDEWHYAIVLR